MTTVLVALVVATTLPWPYQLPPPPLPPVAEAPVQVPTAPPAAQDPAQPPATAKPVILTAPIALPLTPAERLARRDNLGMMESLLTRAVLNGARRVVAETQATAAATVPPRAKGFVLEGYGLFFDVEVPQIDGSIDLTLQQVQREIARRIAEQSPPAGGARRTSQGVPADDVDQNAMYREAVMMACMHTMLDYSKNLDVQPNEWLVVALRAADPPVASMELRDSPTVQLRIKGSDLADYLASRLTKEEALKRVEKREF